MSSIFYGNRIKLSIFGESHGSVIGVTVNGIPAGVNIDMDFIKKEMRRRAGGYDLFSTPRREQDEFEFISGILNGNTTGAPLTVTVRNANIISKDYDKIKDIMRPNHSDYPAFVKFGGNNDYRGGGHFSGRVTAAVVLAGSIIKQCLFNNNIYIAAHILNIGKVYDLSFEDQHFNAKFFSILTNKSFPIINDDKLDEMKGVIISHSKQGSSVGGSVEFAAIGVPAGVGDPFFDSLESIISHLVFSIPAVKALEFGIGTAFAESSGIDVSDGMYFEDGQLKTYSNNCGGIYGGITNGMPVYGKVSFKPTPSISKVQRTIDVRKKENTSLEISGRHDPCIVKRAVVVVEAMVAIAVFDLLNS